MRSHKIEEYARRTRALRRLFVVFDVGVDIERETGRAKQSAFHFVLIEEIDSSNAKFHNKRISHIPRKFYYLLKLNGSYRYKQQITT
jgi:hypothetical protein